MPLLICHRLLLLLLLWVAASHGDSSDDGASDPSMCLTKDQPSTCGDVSISYPFYLAGETKDVKGYANSYCGYPGLGILCDDNKPMLQLNGEAEKYTVTGIEGARANVSLADPQVVDNRCPSVDHNVTIPPVSWLRFPDSTVDHLFFYLGCYFNYTFLQPPEISPIICEGFASGFLGRSFVIPDDRVPPGNWSQACRRIFDVPVLKHGPVDPKDAGWVNHGYGMVLSKGFQLSWESDKKPTECTQCEQSKSNGQCAFRETGEFLACLCSNGRVSDKECGNSTGNATAGAGTHAQPFYFSNIERREVVIFVSFTSNVGFFLRLF